MKKLQLLTVPEFCALARISRAYLYILWRRNEGPPCHRLGRRRFVAQEDAERWIKSHRTARYQT